MMKCELCKKPTNPILIIPLIQPDGKLNTLACAKCAKERGMYCTAHNFVHMGFMDGTHACVSCIGELTKKEAGSGGTFSEQLAGGLPHQELEELNEYVDMIAGLFNWSEDRALVHLLASKSLRSGIPMRDIVRNAIHSCNANEILL